MIINKCDNCGHTKSDGGLPIVVHDSNSVFLEYQLLQDSTSPPKLSRDFHFCSVKCLQEFPGKSYA